MKRNNLIQFIKKYNLGGSIESVIFNIKNNTLKTKFLLEDSTLLGSVKLKEFDYNDTLSFGVYNTEKLLKLISILDDNININFDKNNDKVVFLKLNDDKINLKFMLAETSVIPKTKELKLTPEFELDIILDDFLIDKFIKSTNALIDAKTFFIDHDDLTEETKLIINDDNNIISINININSAKEIKNPRFDINKFKEILINNKELKNKNLLISSSGLLKATFNDDLFNSEYYLVATSL